MSQSGDQHNNLPIAALVVTALAAGGFLALQEPLSSMRHKERISMLTADNVVENVDARLWQDPMQVIHADWNRLVTRVTETGRLPPAAVLPKTVLAMEADLQKRKNLENQLRIVVMMPSNPYADDAEHRRRQRYALVSALAASGYSAAQGDRIGYFVAPGMREGAALTEDAVHACTEPGTGRWLCPMPEKPLLVGFESFTPETNGGVGGWKEILVLWLSLKEFGERPLSKLLALTDLLRPGDNNTRTETVLLGPDDSGGLRKMFNDGTCRSPNDARQQDEAVAKRYRQRARAFGYDTRAHLLDFKYTRAPPAEGAKENSAAAKTDEHGVGATKTDARGLGDAAKIQEPCVDIAGMPEADSRHRKIHILSPRSTVPLDLLFPDSGFAGLTPTEGDRRIAQQLQIKSFFTVLARDDVVIANIVDELHSRGLDDCRSASGIAVISEIDSEYGRALPRVVEQAIEARMGCSIPVHAFGYLRGVDGELPPTVASASASAPAERAPANTSRSDETDLSFATGVPDRAVGVAQTDYIRRLADHIARRHIALSEHDHVGFRAIGVLGTDVYDKQLILHALRERLPAVTFFTTDLDARLNAPREYRWSRNLLIGSAYGLTPPESELEVAPLRDSYQMAFFISAKLALDVNAFHRSPALFTEQARPFPPRLFEIGRSGAIDITVCDTDCLQRSRSFGLVGWIRHTGGVGDEIAKTLFLITPLVALALTSFVVTLTLSQKRRGHRIKAMRWVAGISFVAAVVISMILWSWDSNDLEPWLLTEGISSLPTLMLHITAVVYSICFMILVYGRISQSNTDCESSFKLTRDETGKTGSGAIGVFQPGWFRDAWLRRWVQKIDTARAGKEADRACSAVTIWSRYQSLGRVWSRALRVAAPTVFWSAIVILVLNQDANPLLARNLQNSLDVVRILTVFSVIGVIFICVDALRLGRHLIRAIAVYDLSDWCEDTDETADKQARDGLEKTGCFDPMVARLWRKMNLIVTHSELLNPLLVLPFILLFLLILARMTLFEGWVWTPTLIAVYLGFSVYLLVRALLYQREAADARDRIIAELDRLRIEQAGDEIMVRRTGFVLDEIRAINHGAFVPWTRHPIFQSIIVPTGGVGILSLLGLLT